jgi:hypothetical protein
MSSDFYLVADRLDRLKASPGATVAGLEQVLALIEEEKFAKYFFTDLEDPAWAAPLFDRGVFMRIPPPLEDPENPGYFAMPQWHAGDYLSRVAGRVPEIVRKVALSTETDNARALRTLLEAIRKTPPEVAAETVGQYPLWTRSRFARSMMLAHELGLILEHLATGRQLDAALAVLHTLLEPVETKDGQDDAKIVAGSQHDMYWLSEAMQKNLKPLMETFPIGVVEVAEGQLKRAIELETPPHSTRASNREYSFWRLHISPRSEMNYERDLKNLLVNIVVLALEKACDGGIEEAWGIVARYLESDYAVLRRVAVYILGLRGSQHAALVGRAYDLQRLKPIAAGESEFRKFVEMQFKQLPLAARKEVVNLRLNPDSARVDSVLASDPSRFKGRTMEEKRQGIIAEFRLRSMAPIADFLEGEDRALYQRLVQTHGAPLPAAGEEGVVVTSWEGPETPIEAAKLSEMPVSAVIEYIVGYEAPAESLFGPSREGLARTLQADVEARPSAYASNALLLMDGNVSFLYHAHVFRGLQEAAKKHADIPFKDLVVLFGWIAKQTEDHPGRAMYEGGIAAAKLSLVQLLETLFRVDVSSLAENDAERCARIAADLLRQEEPFSVDEADPRYDPATQSLNCVRGVCLHCLVAYSLHSSRQLKKTPGEVGPVRLAPWIRKALAAQLASETASLAEHSVFGWYFPQLSYLERDWALQARDGIFPSAPERAAQWHAAWNAYIRFSDVYTNIFPVLKAQYRRAILSLGEADGDHDVNQADDKLGSHLLKAYLLKMVDLDSEDGLLRLYYACAADETRAHGNFWLSSVLKTQEPSKDTEVWGRIWALWKWRAQEAGGSEARSNFTKEIGSFTRLLENTPVDLGEMAPMVDLILGFGPGGFETQAIINYLGANSDKFRDRAITILGRIAQSDSMPYLLEDTRTSVKRILEAALLADEDSKAKAIGIINLLGERGDYRWRPLLSGGSA